ncbi:MAG TPA: hypothetical protein VK386_02885, partial [Acidimicrobiales bacterium]|nr:hypothetical protein [Acidimicrobiales bacterium]
MVTGRGLTLSAGAVLLALVGLRFGVEEFVLIAVTASVLLAVGLGTLAVRVRRVRRGLQASVDIPLTTSVGEATAGRLTLVNEGPRWLAPMALSPPCWTV